FLSFQIVYASHCFTSFTTRRSSDLLSKMIKDFKKYYLATSSIAVTKRLRSIKNRPENECRHFLVYSTKSKSNTKQILFYIRKGASHLASSFCICVCHKQFLLSF